jgi:hypothetical protein
MHGSYGRTRAEAQAPASNIPRIRRCRIVTSRRVSRWRSKNPERQAALSAVAVAIKNSELQREPCEQCGTTKNVCADPVSLHPLRVKWCCRSCSIAMRPEKMIRKRAIRRDWLIRIRDKMEADRAAMIAGLERQAMDIIKTAQQIAALDAELCAEVPATEVRE